VPALVIGNEVTVFRAALNLVSVSAQRTDAGFVRLTVRAEHVGSHEPQLVFQCEDTGPVLKDLPLQQEGHSARQILLSRKDADWVLPTAASSNQETSCFSYLISHLEDLGSKLAVTQQIRNNQDQSSGLLSTLCLSFRLPLVVPQCDTKVIVEPDSDMLQDCESDSGSETSEQNKTLASGQPQCISSSTRRRSVLVVDDSPVIRKVIGRALSQIDIDSTMACNGLEGLQLMKERCYDFVLLDFLM